MESRDIFARLTAMFRIHCGILYVYSFTEPLTLLRDVTFDKVNVMKTFFFLETDRLPICLSVSCLRMVDCHNCHNFDR